MFLKFIYSNIGNSTTVPKQFENNNAYFKAILYFTKFEF